MRRLLAPLVVLALLAVAPWSPGGVSAAPSAPPAPDQVRGDYEVVYGGSDWNPVYTPPPAPAGQAGGVPGQVVAAAAPTATFKVVYHDFSPEAKAAFQAAVDIWATLIYSPVPITIDATWKDLGDSPTRLVLGQAVAYTLYRNFGPLRSDAWYPAALANRLVGTDLDPANPEILAEFNSNAAAGWYFGTDGHPGVGKFDLVSVVLHEIGHGLGLNRSVTVEDGKAKWAFEPSYPTIYERSLQLGNGRPLSSFANNSAELATAVTSGDVYFSGPNMLETNGGQRPKIYAPSSWTPGSSVSHLDESSFPASNANALMTPGIDYGEAHHSPGPIGLAMLMDVGWANRSANLLSSRSGVSGGRSVIEVTYAGSTAGAGDAAGETVRFTVSAPYGSNATPKFENGNTTFTAAIAGAACNAASGTAPVTKCYARAKVTSATAGAIEVRAINTSDAAAAAVALTAEVGFYEPRAIVAGVRGSTTDQSEIVVENVGNAAATIVIDLYSSTGQDFPDSRYVQSGVSPGNNRGTTVTSSGAFSGIAIVASDQPVVATLRVRDGRGGGRVALSGMDGFPYPSTVTGNVISLPYVSNALESTYHTDFNVVNTGLTVACAVIQYSFVPGAGAVGAGGKAPVVDSGPGGSGCATGYPIPVAGQLQFTPGGTGGTRAMPAATKNSLMAATITVTNGSAMATVEAYTTDGAAKAAGYEGFLVSASGTGAPPSDLGTSITLPLGLKTEDGYYTQYLFSNPGGSPAKLTLVYKGNTGTHTVQLSVPANGVANHSVYSDNVVPIGFVGGATVTSDVPIAAVAYRAKKVSPTSDVDEDIYTAMNGVPSANAAKTLYLPAVLRRVGKDPAHDGKNSWISVTVPGGGTATVTLRMVGGCAAADVDKVYTATKTFTGSFVFYQNADTDNGFGASSPACFDGAATITSDVPVVAVASYINDLLAGDGEGVYNALSR